MKQELEIELKNLVTIDEFKQLLTHFKLPSSSFVEQTNYYFDTEDFRLKGLGCALRIRKKKDEYTFTLKQPEGDGLLESHESLNDEDALNYISGHLTDKSEMVNLIKSNFNIDPSSLLFLGSLKTTRAETCFKSGLLVFDHSEYLGHEDFEIEFEVPDFLQGRNEFEQLFAQFSIPIRETPNKIRRFFRVKNMKK
ncbi:CYTH domain-containing protein [Pseudalkalibacillus decolorationis]|uniref:CYTH domain-containing protein n=1 Tax=Pseudalkalibacillus decolorationis TaxID=163879 RepID=UPI002148D0B0|nr:CYTH domain-containing protein [Pseudalkalibacillus decolorationis]